MSGNTLYTIGTALGRARDHGVVVRVLVDGHWIEGTVSDVDSYGAVLTGSGAEHHVVRVESITAVRLGAAEPLAEEEPRAHAAPSGSYAAGAPGPTGAHVHVEREHHLPAVHRH